VEERWEGMERGTVGFKKVYKLHLDREWRGTRAGGGGKDLTGRSVQKKGRARGDI